jgi:putative glutamine amidotransferase
MTRSLPLVAITQRVVPVASRGERRDSLDQRWLPFLQACGLEALPVPNRHPDPVSYVSRLGASGVVLSGGGNFSGSLVTFDGRRAAAAPSDDDAAPERDETEGALLRAAVERGWPVLGVCRGMQMLNLFHGGRLARISGHAGARHAVVASGRFTFDAQVNSYHDYGVPLDGLGTGLRTLASADGHAEAIAHERLPQLGVMWHPERNEPFSERDIALFRELFGSARA